LHGDHYAAILNLHPPKDQSTTRNTYLRHRMKVNIQNKKARFEYELIDIYTAGMQLLGTEIKSIRQGKASIAEAYCYMKEGELWIKNMHIAEYAFGNINNHDPYPRTQAVVEQA
jgi:SsrA-binding protein